MTEYSVITLLGLSAWSDWRYRKIGNWLVFPFCGVGVVYQLSEGRGWSALGGMLTAFALMLFPVLLGGMGMGDKKLLIALGAWTSCSDVYAVFLYSLLSCVLAICLMPGRWKKLIQNLHLLSAGWAGHQQVWLPSIDKSALSLPYAVHLLLAYIFFALAAGKT